MTGPDGTPALSISPETQTIKGNLVINYNYHGPACGSIALDHDDESSQCVLWNKCTRLAETVFGLSV